MQLRADFWNYQKSGVSLEISNSFIFYPYSLYSFIFFEIGQSLKYGKLASFRSRNLLEITHFHLARRKKRDVLH